LGEVLGLCKSTVSFILISIRSGVHLASLPWSRLKQPVSILVPASVGKNLHFDYILLGDRDMTSGHTNPLHKNRDKINGLGELH